MVLWAVAGVSFLYGQGRVAIAYVELFAEQGWIALIRPYSTYWVVTTYPEVLLFVLGVPLLVVAIDVGAIRWEES